MSKNLDLSGGGNLDLSGAGAGGGATSSPGPAPVFGGGAPPPAGGYGGGAGGGFAQAALNDSAFQQHLRNAAYNQAEQGWSVARDGIGEAAQQIGGYISQGPAGVSILCFLGGIATTVVGILGILNFTSVAASPFNYVLNMYLTLFGVVTFLLEADVTAVEKMTLFRALAPWVKLYQEEVFQRAQFLTELRGRGLFFVFVGSLAITQCVACLLFLVGVWNLAMGVICVLMSYGYNPVLPGPPGPQQAADHQAPLNPPAAY